MKIWKIPEGGGDKLIAFDNQIIYRGSSKLTDVDKIIFELTTLKTKPKELTGIPLTYIKEINQELGKNHIELFFAQDSTEELKVSDETLRSEIFNYFKSNIPNAEYALVKKTPLQAGKKPLIAFIVALVIFLWVFYIAKGMESGNEYDVSGEHYNSIAGIVLIIASIGVKNVLLVFSSLILITVYSFIKKAKNPPVIEKILLHRR